MIELTLGEVKQQEEKPFPKLMIHTDGTITRFRTKAVGVHIFSPLENCDLWKEFYEIEMSRYSDYNETITLKNK